MSEISPHEKEIWEKHIIGKLYHFRCLNRDIWIMVLGWENNSPLYKITVKTEDGGWFTRRFSREKNGWEYWSMSIFNWRRVAPLTIKTFDNDLRYPRITKRFLKRKKGTYIYPDLFIFRKVIKIIKNKLSFFNDTYLLSEHLPPELVARVFSFVRRCEIEKL
jgi:hypothetical protein